MYVSAWLCVCMVIWWYGDMVIWWYVCGIYIYIYKNPMMYVEYQVPHLCHANATGRAAETKGRQGVHPTPCRAASAAPATQQPPAERRRPRDARAYIRPLAEQQVPHLPRKSYRQGGGDQGTRDGTDARGTHACHAKRPAERRRRTRDTGRTPEGHRGVQPSPWQCTLLHACHAKATGRAADTGGTPEGHRGVHPTPWQCTLSHACRDTGATPEGHRGVHPTPWPCIWFHACHAKATGDQGTPAGHRRTPGRTSDPVAVHIAPRLPFKSDRRPRDASGTPADTGAYIRPRGSAHCPTPATQKRPETKGHTPGRTSDPVHIVPRLWVMCILVCVCACECVCVCVSVVFVCVSVYWVCVPQCVSVCVCVWTIWIDVKLLLV